MKEIKLPVRVGSGRETLEKLMTKKQAMYYAQRTIPLDLARAGFVASVFESDPEIHGSHFYRINFSKGIRSNSIKPAGKKRTPAKSVYQKHVAALLKKKAPRKNPAKKKPRIPSQKFSIFQDSPADHDKFICIASSESIGLSMLKLLNANARPGVRFKMHSR